jgi:hypothetical protein
MIWFTCNKCGKALGRPENSIGAMIFCDCGQGLTVPWDSTIAAPEPVASPSVPAATAIPLENQSDLPEILPRARRRPGRRVADPAYCLNHETVPSQHKCPDCGEAFCADCVLTFQGMMVCGPCKNYRIRRLLRPAQLSGYALASVLLAVITGPMVFCLYPLAQSSGTSVLSFLALVPQLLALLLGALGLRSTEADARRSGRSLAITGIVAAGVACVLTLVGSVFVNRPLGG